ncbi:MAG: SoxR reducing system RseC family protein [Spirochaetales bacterium]|nr:SoxR reducing system RseC family protein [Spirochaetales bacterium]
MKQIVKISKKNKAQIMVTCDKSACENCKGNFFCGSKKSEFEVNNPEELKAKVGDTVKINIPTGKTIFTSFMSFGLPLIFFFVGLVIGVFKWPDNQLIQFGIGLAFLVVAFIINGIYFKIYRKKYSPEIDEIIND